MEIFDPQISEFITVLYHGTNETPGTVGTLLSPKMPKIVLKRTVLHAKLPVFYA